MHLLSYTFLLSCQDTPELYVPFFHNKNNQQEHIQFFRTIYENAIEIHTCSKILLWQLDTHSTDAILTRTLNISFDDAFYFFVLEESTASVPISFIFSCFCHFLSSIAQQSDQQQAIKDQPKPFQA